MGIIKNDIPILEYDNVLNAVINPDHEHIQMKLPQKRFPKLCSRT